MKRPLISAAILIACVSCQRQTAEAQSTSAIQPANVAPPVPAAAEAKLTASNEETPYTIRIVPGDTAAGKPSTSVVEVTPTAGYKMNIEFPVKLKVSDVKGVAIPKREFVRGDAELDEKALRFSIAFTPETPGQVSMAGTTDFSVCNDSTCKLFRGEELAWEVAVK